MLTIHLHIGRGKTGTTTIQRWLAANRDALLRDDVDYLMADDRGRGCGHQQFAKSFIANRPDFMVPAQHPAQVRDEILDAIRNTPAGQVVLSSENFPLADVAEVAAFFRKLPMAHRVHIIFFARSQDELAESEYNQMVKLKRVTEPFASYAENSLEGCHFDRELVPWERYFGRENITCHIYDAGRDDVVAQFLSAVSPDLAPLAATGNRENEKAFNTAVGFKALCVMRLLNGIEIADRRAIYDAILKGFAGSDQPVLFLDAEAAGRFRGRFAESNRAFTSRYLGRSFEDLGGRRYADNERDTLIAEIRSLGMPFG